LEQTVLEMNNIFSKTAIAFAWFIRLFVSRRLPFYFISIEMFSNQNNILANTEIKGGGGRIFKQSYCSGEIEQKRLKTTGLNAQIETCI